MIRDYLALPELGVGGPLGSRVVTLRVWDPFGSGTGTHSGSAKGTRPKGSSSLTRGRLIELPGGSYRTRHLRKDAGSERPGRGAKLSGRAASDFPEPTRAAVVRVKLELIEVDALCDTGLLDHLRGVLRALHGVDGGPDDLAAKMSMTR